MSLAPLLNQVLMVDSIKGLKVTRQAMVFGRARLERGPEPTVYTR